MEIDKVYETQISSLIESQFPESIREIMGPVFVGFVKLYYEWLETQGQALFHSRRIMSYKDIDTTTDQFLVYFKNKYLANIQLETNSNIKLLIKHSLDIYRSKGTPQAIDLLFRLVFGVGADIYYPGSDVFRLSDGTWTRPVYLEVSLREDSEKFVGHEIIGLRSNARAFVERVVRRRTKTKFNDILYISSIVGNFQTGELINTTVAPFDVTTVPAVIGSLTSLSVVDGSYGFSIGDLVTLTSLHGTGGIARVASTQDQIGTVAFNIANGGYGYTTNANIFVSNSIVVLSNVVVNTAVNNTHAYFEIFEYIKQPMAVLSYNNGTGNFASNNIITTYYPNNSIKGSGTCLTLTQTNSTAGYMTVYVTQGNLSANAIYNQSNAVSANLLLSGGYTDITAQGSIISETDNTFIHVTNATSNFVIGEVVQQAYGSNIYSGVVVNNNINLGNGTVGIINTIGAMVPGSPITGLTSGTTANLFSLDLAVGVITINNTFLTDNRAPIVTTFSGTSALFVRQSVGTGAVANVGMLDLTEVVSLGTDLLYPQLGINISSTYNFTSLVNANLTSNVSASLAFVNATIGRISTLTNINSGVGYSAKPAVRVYQPYVEPLLRKGYQFDISIVSGAFQPGELVTQTSTGARGIFRSIDTNTTPNHYYMDRASLFKDFKVTSNVTSQIVGVSSGAIANINFVNFDNQPRSLDVVQEFLGIDAIIMSNTQTSNGAILSLNVLDSGFGFTANELATYVSSDGRAGLARTVLTKQGIGSGYYSTLGGRTSSEKKLFDGYYYQDFSYEIRSSITLNKYKDMLNNILHVAGTIPFGAYYNRTTANAYMSAISSPITQT